MSLEELLTKQKEKSERRNGSNLHMKEFHVEEKPSFLYSMIMERRVSSRWKLECILWLSIQQSFSVSRALQKSEGPF